MSVVAYQAYLQSSDWQYKRRVVINWWKGRCARCGRKPKSEKTLHIHHESYATDLRKVSVKDLKPLCEKCHDKVGAAEKIGVPKNCIPQELKD